MVDEFKESVRVAASNFISSVNLINPLSGYIVGDDDIFRGYRRQRFAVDI